MTGARPPYALAVGAPRRLTGEPPGVPAAVDLPLGPVEELVGVPGDQDAGSLGPASWSWLGQTLAYAVTVLVLVTLTFMLPRALPGDPLSAMLDSSSAGFASDPAVRAAQAAQYGLDQPLLVQYVRYLGSLARGDLGVSNTSNLPVTTLIRDRLPWTLLLVGSSMVVAVSAGVMLGVRAGWQRSGPLDRRVLVALLGFRSLPVFFLATLASFVFAARLGWFPLGGESSLSGGHGVVGAMADVAHHLALPMLVLALEFTAGYYLLMRAGMVGELGADYLLSGRAKGATERRLMYGYAARNALLPVVTRTAMQFGFALTGAVFVERVFTYKGVGLLLVDAVAARDYPVLQACFLLLSLAVVTVNFVCELSYKRIDPRVVA